MTNNAIIIWSPVRDVLRKDATFGVGDAVNSDGNYNESYRIFYEVCERIIFSITAYWLLFSFLEYSLHHIFALII